MATKLCAYPLTRVRIKENHEVSELLLPDLGPDHDYSVPLDQPTEIYRPPKYNLSRPNEPSSHSSSVQANPMANYHSFQYPDYRNGYRIVTTTSANGANRRAADMADPHRLATLASIARINGPAGEEARARLAAANPSLGVVQKKEPRVGRPEPREPKATVVRRSKKRSKAKLPGSALRIGPGVQGAVDSPLTRHELSAEARGELREKPRARTKPTLPDSSLIPSAAAARVGVVESRDGEPVRVSHEVPSARHARTSDAEGTERAPSSASRQESGSRALIKNVDTKASKFSHVGQHQSSAARLFMPLYAPAGVVLPSENPLERRASKNKRKGDAAKASKNPEKSEANAQLDASQQHGRNAIRMLFTSSMRSVADSVGPSASKSKTVAPPPDSTEPYPINEEHLPTDNASVHVDVGATLPDDPGAHSVIPAEFTEIEEPEPHVAGVQPAIPGAGFVAPVVPPGSTAAPAVSTAPSPGRSRAAAAAPSPMPISRSAIMSVKHSLADAEHSYSSYDETTRPVSFPPTYEAPAPPYEAPEQPFAENALAIPTAPQASPRVAGVPAVPPLTSTAMQTSPVVATLSPTLASPISATLPSPTTVPTRPASEPYVTPVLNSAALPPLPSDRDMLAHIDPVRRIEQVRAATSTRAPVPRLPSNQLPIYMAHRRDAPRAGIVRPMRSMSLGSERRAPQPQAHVRASLDLADEPRQAPLRHVPTTRQVPAFVGGPREIGAGRVSEAPQEAPAQDARQMAMYETPVTPQSIRPVVPADAPVPAVIPSPNASMQELEPQESMPPQPHSAGATQSAVVPTLKDGIPHLSFSQPRTASGFSIPSVPQTSVTAPSPEQSPAPDAPKAAPETEVTMEKDLPSRPQYESAFTEYLPDAPADAPLSRAESTSRADARYNEVQRELAAERARQDRAEKQRVERRERRRRRNEGGTDKKARDLEREWARCEEMLQRQREAGLPPPNIA